MTRVERSVRQKRIEREKLLNKTITRIRSSLDIEKTKKAIVNEVGKIFDADRCYIRLFKQENDNLLPVDNHSEYLRSPEEVSLKDYTFSEQFERIIKLHYKSNCGFIIPDVDEFMEGLDPDNIVAKTVSQGFGVKSHYCFPIINNDDFIGAFAVQYTKSKVILSEEEIEFLKVIASQAGFAIKQAEMYSIISQKSKRENLLRKVTEKVRSSLDLGEVLDTIGYELFHLFNVDKVAISRYIEQEIEPFDPSWTFLAEYQRKNLPFLNDITPSYLTSCFFADEIFYERKNIVIENMDKRNQEEYPEYFLNIYRKLGIKSLLAVPIIHNNENWGAIGLIQVSSYRKWTQEEISLIETLTEKISITIKQAEMFTLIKKYIDQEKILRPDDSLVVKKNLASNLGLCCATTYSVLSNKYKFLKRRGHLLSDSFFYYSLDSLRTNTCLSDPELSKSLKKLKETGLINYKKKRGEEGYLISLAEDEELISHYFSSNNSDE